MALNRANLLAVAVAAALAIVSAGTAGGDLGPYSGGPTDFFTTSAGDDIALSVVYPDGFEAGRTYPAILEIAGYENASASADGRTVPGQTRDELCRRGPCPPEPPLAEDSHARTSTFRYSDDGYVVVHASLPGTGCSSGEFDLYSFEKARAGYEVIEDWIVRQPWSNGRVGIVGHSFSGATGWLVAAQEGLAAREGRPHHLVAVTLSGLIDDNYRGITFPGGVLNTLFPPLWYYGIRPAFDVLGGSAQGVFRNLDNANGRRCALNTARHTRDPAKDPTLQGTLSRGFDSEYWQSISSIGHVGLIDVPTHITGTFQDQETGARGFTHLWEKLTPGLPKRLVMANGDHDTNAYATEMWADRKAWMDYWMRGIAPDPSWGWTDPSSGIRPVSVRTLFELHGSGPADLASNGRLDSPGYPIEGTRWTDHFLCAGRSLSTDRGACGAGADTYLSGTKRQSWNFQAGYGAGPPATTADAPDQILLRGPVVGPDETWAIAGPIIANLHLSIVGRDSDLFVQLADEDTTTGVRTYLQRGWLKATHRAIDRQRSDFSDVDPSRPDFLYRPWRPHTTAEPVPSERPIDYLVEVWPVAHVFRPGHRLVVIVSAPPAIDSDYSFAVPTSWPSSVNTLVYNDPQHPSRITLPVVPLADMEGLGDTAPGCPRYWQVRCVRI